MPARTHTKRTIRHEVKTAKSDATTGHTDGAPHGTEGHDGDTKATLDTAGHTE